MTQISGDEIKQMIASLEEIRESLPPVGNRIGNSQAFITIDAGGLGVWVASTACLIMLALMIVGALWYSADRANTQAQLVELREENKTMQAFLSAIYIQAPHLKPAEEKDK